MKIERTRNAKRNIVAGAVSKVSSLLLPFLVRTAFIYSLGAEYLGLNSLFTSILSVLNMTELGFSSAIVFSMYEPIANDDKSTVCALLNYYRKAYRYIGLIILTVGLILVPFLPNLINGDCPDELNIYILYIIYLLNTVASYWLFAYKKSLCEAFQRNDIISIAEAITVGLTNLVQLVLLLVWRDIFVYYFYVITLLVFTIVNNLICSRRVDKEFPEYKCMGKLSQGKKDEIKKQVSGVMVGKICQMTRNSFDSIFTSAFIGLTMTTIYNNYYYIITAVVGIMNILTNAMLGGIGNSMKTESVDKNYNDFNKFNFMYMWISGWATVTMLCLYNNFMIIWVGEDLTLPVLAAVLFSLYFYTLKIGDIRATYTSAAGLWWENRMRSIAEVIANIVLNFLFVQLWGVYGIITATIIPIMLINNTVGTSILYKNYFKGKRIFGYFKDNLLYAGATLVSCIVTFMICDYFPNTIMGLIIRFLICLIVPNLLFLLLFFKNKNFKLAKKWLLNKMKK